GQQHAIVYEPGLPVRYLTLDAAGRAATVTRIDLPHTPMIHDVAFTASSIVVLDLPVTFQPEAQGARPGLPWLWDERKGARVGLFPRAGDVGRLQWFEARSASSSRAPATWAGCNDSRRRSALLRLPFPQRLRRRLGAPAALGRVERRSIWC